MAGQRLTRLGCYAVVVDAQGRLLPVHQPAQDRWSLPGGGVAFGEHPVDALQREVAEETGYTVMTARLTGTHDNVYDAGDGVQRHGVRLLYRTTVSGVPRLPADGEVDQIT